MKKVLLLVSMTVAVTALQAQDSLRYRSHSLSTRLLTVQGRVAEGYLYAISTTALLLSSEKCRPNWSDTLTNRQNVQSFDYQVLNTVRIHSRGSIGHSALIGLLIGAGSGALAGSVSGDSKSSPVPAPWGGYVIFTLTAREKAIAFGFLCGVTGTIVGLIAGIASHRIFSINAKKDRLNQMSHRLTMRIGSTNPE